MQNTDLFGHEIKAEILPPEERDHELLAAWESFRCTWRLKTHGRDTLTSGEHKALVGALDRASVAVIKAPARTLEGIRCKLAMVLCSGPDAELFRRRFVLDEPLPEIMGFNDFATSQLCDALEAVERLMAAEARVTH